MTCWLAAFDTYCAAFVGPRGMSTASVEPALSSPLFSRSNPIYRRDRSEARSLLPNNAIRASPAFPCAAHGAWRLVSVVVADRAACIMLNALPFGDASNPPHRHLESMAHATRHASNPYIQHVHPVRISALVQARRVVVDDSEER